MIKKNPKLTQEQARELVALFFAGDTTPAEENRLYEFYSSASFLPGDLEQYRHMFSWYSSLPKTAEPHHGKRRWAYVGGMAAALAALVAVGAVLIANSSKFENRLYSAYAGSYVVHKGKRISDLSKIYGNIIRAERVADSISVLAAQDAFFNENIDSLMMEDAFSHISDVKLAAQIRDDFFGN